MSIFVPNPQARRIEAAIVERLHIDRDQLRAGTLSSDFHGGDDYVTVEWECSARIPVEEFQTLLNSPEIAS